MGIDDTSASQLCRSSSAQNCSLVILSGIQERGKTASHSIGHMQCNCPGMLGPAVEKVML